MTADMPFGDIEIYDHPPDTEAVLRLTESEAGRTSQWDLADRAIEALMTAADWHIPLVVQITFDGPNDPKHPDNPKPVTLWSRQTPVDVLVARDESSNTYLDVDAVDAAALGDAFRHGLGPRDSEADSGPWDRPGVRWLELRVLAAQVLIGQAIDVERLIVNIKAASPVFYEVVTEGDQSWVQTNRPGQMYPPVDLFIGNEFFEPEVIVALSPYWSLYGHAKGQQAARFQNYLTTLTGLGWATDFTPVQSDQPYYRSYQEVQQQIAETRATRGEEV